MVYLPGRTVKPVSYSIGRLASSLRGFVAQLDIHVVAHVGDGRAVVVLDFADEIDQGMFGAAAFGQGQFTPRNLDNDGDKILRSIQLEVIDLHGDSEFGDRIVQHQRVFQLAFFVGGVELAEHLAGIVALAVIERGGVQFSVILMRRNLPSSAALVV